MPAGLLLAAGAGRRMGGPKALVELGGEPLVRRALRVLAEGGCAPLTVVLGAAAEQVAPLVHEFDEFAAGTVVAEDWAEGMGASLRAGLDAVAALHAPTDAPDAAGDGRTAPSTPSGATEPSGDGEPEAVVVHLVDLPGVTPEAVARLAALASPSILARAAYAGVPGHPVLLGRDHWAAVRESARGDAGARDYLKGHPDLVLVECGDVAEPADVDTPEQLARARDATTPPPGR